MSYLDEILQSAQGGQLVSNLAQRFGLSDEQMDRAIKALAPALEVGLNNAAEQPELFEKVLGDIASPLREAVFDEPGAAQKARTPSQSATRARPISSARPAAGPGRCRSPPASRGCVRTFSRNCCRCSSRSLLSGLIQTCEQPGLGGVLGQLVSSGALGSILEQMLGGGAPAPQPEPAPMPTPRGGATAAAACWRTAWSILGGRCSAAAAAAPDPYGDPADARRRPWPQRRRLTSTRAPAPTRSAACPTAGSGVDSAGDRRDQEDAADRTRRQAAAKNAGARSDLESILGQMFGKR